MTAWIPPGWTPRKYVHDLLVVAFPDAYAFEGTEEDDVEAYLKAENGIAKLQRYVADHPDADLPDWMRERLRVSATGVDPRPQAAA